MIECGESGATGFLVSVGEGIAFMTAGHVFCDKKREDKYGETVLLPNIDWSQYNLARGDRAVFKKMNIFFE